MLGPQFLVQKSNRQEKSKEKGGGGKDGKRRKQSVTEMDGANWFWGGV